MFAIPNVSCLHYPTMLGCPDVLAVAAEGLVIAQRHGSGNCLLFLTPHPTSQVNLSSSANSPIYAYVSDMWCIFFGRLSHVLECHDQSCKWKNTPGYAEACRQAMEPLYIRTHAALIQLGPRGSEGLKIIEKFARQLGISEASIIAKWKREQECCNPLCSLREQDEEQRRRGALKMSRCTRCVPGDEVYYHGKDCQKA